MYTSNREISALRLRARIFERCTSMAIQKSIDDKRVGAASGLTDEAGWLLQQPPWRLKPPHRRGSLH
jgi:hypothetical protein